MSKRQKTLKLTVLERMGSHRDHVEDAARRMLSILFSTRMLNTLSIRIEIRKTKLGKSTWGTCGVGAAGSKPKRNYTIELDGKLGRDGILGTLAHELIHVQQAVSGRYQRRYWKTTGGLMCRWYGEVVGNWNEIPYRQRPWEREAFALQSVLVRLHRAVQRGKKTVRRAREEFEARVEGQKPLTMKPLVKVLIDRRFSPSEVSAATGSARRRADSTNRRR
jgi:hypothetical protein